MFRILKSVVVLAVVFVVATAGLAFQKDAAVSVTCGPQVSTPIVKRGIDYAQRWGKWLRGMTDGEWGIMDTVHLVRGGLDVITLWYSAFHHEANGVLEDKAVTGWKLKTAKNQAAALASCCPAANPDDDDTTTDPPEAPWDPKNASFSTRPQLVGPALAADALRQAGFPEAQIPMGVAVAKYESGFNPLSVNNWKPTAHMKGMWQIYSEVHPTLIAGGDWRDPYDNAQMAYAIWKAGDRAGGPRSWHPWSTRNAAARLAPTYKGLGKAEGPADPAPLQDCVEPPAKPGDPAGPVIGSMRNVTFHGKTYPVAIPKGKAGIAIMFAIAQIGEPYVWAAHGPNAWDCSGLTAGAWKAAGINVTPQSSAQNRSLKHVPLSQAQPGDIFWHPGHVQLYIGRIGGRRVVIEAANPRAGVRIDSSGWMHPQAVLRPYQGVTT